MHIALSDLVCKAGKSFSLHIFLKNVYILKFHYLQPYFFKFKKLLMGKNRVIGVALFGSNNHRPKSILFFADCKLEK